MSFTIANMRNTNPIPPLCCLKSIFQAVWICCRVTFKWDTSSHFARKIIGLFLCWHNSPVTMRIWFLNGSFPCDFRISNEFDAAVIMVFITHFGESFWSLMLKYGLIASCVGHMSGQLFVRSQWQRNFTLWNDVYVWTIVSVDFHTHIHQKEDLFACCISCCCLCTCLML